MVLGYALNLAKFQLKVYVEDVVIMPPYFGQVERKGLV